MDEIKGFYEFGDFRLDRSNKMLQRQGEPIPLTPKVFDTLLFLVENPGRLLEKNDLMTSIWKDSFVEESNLTFNIKMLRKALGDDATNPTFIETIPRRGYRFIAEVKEFVEDKETKSIQQPHQSPVLLNKTSPISKRLYFIAAFAFITIISSLVFAAWVWQRNAEVSAPILATKFDSTKISDTGKVHNVVISSDGKYVAYTNLVNGKSSLWLRHLETASNTPIIPPSDDVYYGLAFSQNSETLFFTRRVKEGNDFISIYRIPIFGGVPIKIAERCQGWISVSPDDRQISFVRYEKGVGDLNKLMVIDVDGKNEREIKVSESPNVFWANAFSPDGKTIAAVYGHSMNASQQMGLVEVNLETGEPRELTPEKFFHIRGLEWLPNKSGLIFSADKSLGTSAKIWQVNYNTGKVDSLTSDSISYSILSLNQNADLLAATTVTADFYLFIQDSESPTNFKKLTQARDKFAFTPDGKIVYASDTAGNEDIWIMDADGANQRQLTNDNALDFFPVVSPDSHYVLFTSNRTGESQVWRMNIDGSNLLQITRKDGGYPRFVTPDSKFLYYQSAMTNNLMKVSLDGGDEILFSDKVGYLQSFSPDGSRLAFLYDEELNKTRIKVISVETKEILKTFPVPEGKGFAYFLKWQNNDTLAYSMSARSANNTIWVQNLNGETPTLLHTLNDGGFMDIQFSPDGKKTAFIRGNWRHDAFLLKGLK